MVLRVGQILLIVLLLKTILYMLEEEAMEYGLLTQILRIIILKILMAGIMNGALEVETIILFIKTPFKI